MNLIDDINDTRIRYYRNLQQINPTLKDEKIFIAEGEKVVFKALNSSLKIISIFALEEYHEKYKHLIDSKINIELQFYADKELMEKIVGYRLHHGIMALVQQPEESSLEELSSPIVILNGIIDSENIGSIVRNCAAFNINSLIFDKETSSPFLRRAVRVSMGTIFSMKYHHSEDLWRTIINLKNLGCQIIASEITSNAQNIGKFDFPDKYAVIFGNEGHGIDSEILEICDNIVYLPINENVSSINVAASSAVFLYLAQKNHLK
jgi:tRNA G18 (ribose-2'-O)-methylase SpoU